MGQVLCMYFATHKRGKKERKKDYKRFQPNRVPTKTPALICAATSVEQGQHAEENVECWEMVCLCTFEREREREKERE